jgi:hypothetical protein
MGEKQPDSVVVQDDGAAGTVNMQAVVVVSCCPAAYIVNGSLENLAGLGLNKPAWAEVR